MTFSEQMTHAEIDSLLTQEGAFWSEEAYHTNKQNNTVSDERKCTCARILECPSITLQMLTAVAATAFFQFEVMRQFEVMQAFFHLEMMH
jgi:hypothetical protein